jgi:MFS family permease
VEIVFLIACGWAGDRFGNRILISMTGLCTAMLGMILIVALPLSSNNGRLAGYYLTQASPAPFVALLSLISSNVAGYTKKTTVAAMYLIGYCIGNIIGMHLIPNLEIHTLIATTRSSDIPSQRRASLCPCRSHNHRVLGRVSRYISLHPRLLRVAEQEESCG